MTWEVVGSLNYNGLHLKELTRQDGTCEDCLFAEGLICIKPKGLPSCNRMCRKDNLDIKFYVDDDSSKKSLVNKLMEERYKIDSPNESELMEDNVTDCRICRLIEKLEGKVGASTLVVNTDLFPIRIDNVNVRYCPECGRKL